MIAGILLAAGAATRFGANKLLHPLADGTPIAVVAARRLRSVLPFSLAVIRREDHELAQRLIEAGLQVVPCARAAQGLSGSIACGIEAAAAASGWLIALADMPFVQPETIRALAVALEEGAALAAPEYQGRRGHPVAFHRRFREALLSLTGDQGARELLVRHATQLRRIAVADRGVILDIDRPDELPARPCYFNRSGKDRFPCP